MSSNVGSMAGEGAALGTAIMPGIGTAIGAGLGALGGWLGNKGTEAWNQEYIKRQKEWYTDMLGRSRTNAMGQLGEQAATGAQRALASLQPSAEATSAANRTNQMGGRLLSQAQGGMDLGRVNAQRVAGAQKHSTMNLARESGLGGSAIADLTRALSENTSQGLSQTANQLTGQAQNAIAGAGDMFSKAPGIINQDLQTRFNTYVAPYLVQHAPFKAEVDQIKEDPYQGLEGALGTIGNTMISTDFMSKLKQQNNQNYAQGGVNAGGNQQDLSGIFGRNSV